MTGCGSLGRWPGTGKAASILFAREGARVVLVDRDPAAAADAARIIEREGGQAEAMIADVTRSEDCQRAVARALEQFGKLDVLVNNVAIVRAPPSFGRHVVDVAEESSDRILEVNLKSAMLMSKYAIPAMEAIGGGSIIHVSSVAALRGVGHVAYSAAKGGLVSLTIDMAVWHGRQGIRVNCIAPGRSTRRWRLRSRTIPQASAACASRPRPWGPREPPGISRGPRSSSRATRRAGSAVRYCRSTGDRSARRRRPTFHR